MLKGCITLNIDSIDKCKSKVRSSNLELYRIICMFMIAIGHYVHNSGLLYSNGPMSTNPYSINTLYLFVIGMWGKIGINCFMMITGYFMSTNKISIRKFIKLMLWIYLYKFVIYGIFLSTGYETIGINRLFQLVMPVWGFSSNFVSCFIVFWLTIPFWNILVHNMTKRQHQLLLLLLVGMYSILGDIPHFDITFNYVTWFGVIYVVSSYIRMYPIKLFENKNLWMVLSIITILAAMCSVIFMQLLFQKANYFFLIDSNKFLALAVAVTTFLWFKNMNIPYNKLINAIGASTFGVLLIHTNSDAMRQWLWKDTVDCVGHYSLPFWQLVGFSMGVVFTIFFSCIIIDRIRIKFLEEPFFKWYDRKPRFQKLTNFLTKE